MKQVYQCDLCGQVFESERGAVACEKMHYSIDKVIGKYENGAKYPYAIKVYYSNCLRDCSFSKEYRLY